MGRHFVGIEIDPEYVAIAEDKIARTNPSTYKGYYVSFFLGKVQSIRDIDAAVLFPPQLTSVEKKKLRVEENGDKPSPGVNGHKKAQRKPKEKAPTLF